MWGSKKPEPRTEKPMTPGVSVPAGAGAGSAAAGNPATGAAAFPAAAPPSVEVTPMSQMDAVRPMTGASSGTARLGPSLHVKGEISGNEDLHVDGSVEGLVSLEDRKLTVGASAKLTADIVAREVVIYGSVKGNLRARDRIEIKKDGSVVGDLTTARIMIEDGAYFKGSIEIDRGAGAPETGRAAFARAGGKAE